MPEQPISTIDCVNSFGKLLGLTSSAVLGRGIEERAFGDKDQEKSEELLEREIVVFLLFWKQCLGR